MHFPVYIAKRYLVSKKSHNIINIISVISVAGITIGTMALIIVLSVFNGFTGLVMTLFNSFNPDLTILPKEGKTFHMREIPIDSLKKIPGLAYYTEVVEENALAQFNQKQHIVMMKGVSDDFLKMTPMKGFLLDGKEELKEGDREYALIGAGVAYLLSIYLDDFTKPLTLYVPKRTRKNFTGPPDQAFNTNTIPVSGVFAIQQEFDESYVIVPVDFVRKLLDYSDEVTSLDIGIAKGADVMAVQKQADRLLGSKYEIRNRLQQQPLLYRIMKSEKWAVFLILTLILFIAAFNMIGSLSMLILDKKKDIAVLWSLGAGKQMIRRIFLLEGMMISISGGLLGLLLGGLIAWLQQQYGFLKLGGEAGTYVVDAYPVKVQLLDFISVLVTVILIGLATAWYPVRQISRKYLSQRINFYLMR
jgi:lipoprotein-releasing system permease protein